MAAGAARRAQDLQQAGRDPAQGPPDLPDVIPGAPARFAGEPGIQTRAMALDSGFAPRGAPRNDGWGAHQGSNAR
jgi:hypothetical protein